MKSMKTRQEELIYHKGMIFSQKRFSKISSIGLYAIKIILSII